MSLNFDVWHYGRQEYAERYINLFNIGITNGIVFFAKKGYGKTSFLQRDIKPLAKKQNYDVIYCSFLNGPAKPLSTLLQAIKNHFRRQSNNKLSCTDDESIDQLSHALMKLSRKKKRTLFLFDDMSYLSTSASFDSLIACIRTALDQYSEKLYAIYTGSSQMGLGELFSNHHSPLYHFASQYDIQELDIDFLYFICGQYLDMTGKEIVLTEAEVVWKRVEYSPYHFMNIIKLMFDNKIRLEHACDRYLVNINTLL